MKRIALIIIVMGIAFSGYSQKSRDGTKNLIDQEVKYVCLLTGPEQRKRQEALKKEVFSQVKKYE